MQAAVQVIGKQSTAALNRDDLVTMDKDLAEFMNIRFGATHRR